MALFESKLPSHVTVDDTQILTCVIEAAENVQGHTVYLMRVHRGHTQDNSWQVSRRYSDFDTLNTMLSISGIDLPLPPKKMFGNLEREFIAERQQGLQNYINTVLSHPCLSLSLPVRRFLDPHTYRDNYLEIAMQHASMFFRSEPLWEIIEPINEMGWRIRKQYFLIKPKADTNQRFLLAWTPFGPDKCLEKKDLQSLVKILSALQHPFIYPVEFASVNEIGSMFIRKFHPDGTLRDLLCKTKPKGHFLRKYGKPKMASGLPPAKVQLYGKQILMALKFLHDRGLPHGHLHSGNVIVENDICKLLEVENQVLGLPSLWRPCFVQLKKVQSLESVDVYCFGQLLYEMAFGIPCVSPTYNNFPASCPAELRCVLEAILTAEAGKNGIPTITDLLGHPFFAVVNGLKAERIHTKMSSQLKEALKKSQETVVMRLKDEQKIFRRSQRLSKMQVQLNSEEEKRKRQNERRKQQKLGATTPIQNGQSPSPTPSASSMTGTTTPKNGLPQGLPLSPSPQQLPPKMPPVKTPPPLAPSGGPPPPPPPPPPPAPASEGPALPNVSSDRKALLSSIEGFNKAKLKKASTNTS